jgi:hypothetical protein
MGKYEQQLVRLNLSRNLGPVDSALYRFFENFPEKRDPEDYSKLDVEYYRKIREKEQKPQKETEKDLLHVCAFFNYLIDFEGYNLPNPASKREPSIWRELRLKSLTEQLPDKSGQHSDIQASNTLDTRLEGAR